jgi:hypothetical protein
MSMRLCQRGVAHMSKMLMTWAMELLTLKELILELKKKDGTIKETKEEKKKKKENEKAYVTI